MIHDPTFLGILAILAGIGVAMVRSAGRYNLLEQRGARRCPACGRLLEHGRCRCG